MPSPQIERKLAAIMFTDIAGYTALSAKDSTKASKLLKTQKDILKPIVEKHGGSWMKEMGDGLLLTFDSATSAVECSIAIQEATKDIEDLNLRIGLHEGEVIKQDGDVIGDDVNVASRIEPFSAIGGVAISDKIYRAISSNQEFETKYIGKPKLKGVSQEVKVYCITSHGLPETDVAKVSAKLEEESKFNIYAITGGILTAIGVAFWIAVGVFDVSFGGKDEIPSIAIIPFENKGADEDAFYAYSISSELISDITSAGLIRVASLNNVEKLSDATIEEIAQKLNVRYITTGTLWRTDSIFHLSLELYDTKKSKIKLSKSWEKKWDDLASIKGSLAENILQSLKVSTKQNISKTPTSNIEAYEYYLKGKYKYEKRENMDDMEIARGLLQKAIELDENLSIAKNLLGITYDVMGDNDQAMEIYLENLKKAEDIGDMVSIGRSLINIGNIENKKGGSEIALDNYTRSLKIFEEISDNHRMVIALLNIGNIYSAKRDYELALDYYTRSLKLAEEIGNKSSIASNLSRIGGVYWYKDFDSELALDYYTRSLKIFEEIGDKNKIGSSLINIGSVYFQKSDYTIVLDYFTRSLKIFEELGDKRKIGNALHRIGGTYFTMGEYDKALDYYNHQMKVVEEYGDKRSMGYTLAKIGVIYWNKGNYDKTLEYYALSLQIREELGEKRKMGNFLSNIGWIYYEIGDYDKALNYYNRSLKIYEELGWENISNEINNIGLVYFQQEDYNKAVENLEKSATIQMEIDSTIKLETASHLFLSKKILGQEYNITEIHALIKEQEEIKDYLNFALFKLLEDPSYLETAYNQVQEKADNLEPDVAAKFLSYPIPKAIVEEWEKVK